MKKWSRETKITYQDETKTVKQWSAWLGIPPSTILCRLQRDLPLVEVLNGDYTRLKRKKKVAVKAPAMAQEFSVTVPPDVPVSVEQEKPLEVSVPDGRGDRVALQVTLEACRAILSVPMDDGNKLAALALLMEKK